MPRRPWLTGVPPLLQTMIWDGVATNIDLDGGTDAVDKARLMQLEQDVTQIEARLAVLEAGGGLADLEARVSELESVDLEARVVELESVKGQWI